MAKLTMVKALNLALLQEMERDEDVLVIGEDVGVDGGVFRVTEDLHRKFGSKRVIDSPLAEAAIIGTSVGMALYGLKPVAEATGLSLPKALRVSVADPEKRALKKQVKQLEAKVAARREVRALERKLAALEVEHDLLKKAIRFNIERRRRSSSS